MFRLLASAAVLALAASPAVAQEAPASPALAMVRAFSQVCGQTDGDPARVAAAAQAVGWTRGGEGDGLTIWRSVASEVRMSLLTGEQSGEGKARWVCSIQMRPAAPIPAEMLTAEMGSGLVALDPSKGLYLMAPSGPAVRANDAAVVNVSTDATGASLLYMRPRP